MKHITLNLSLVWYITLKFSVFALSLVDGCVTWKVLGNRKWRPSMEYAWKSLLRNVTFFWLLSQGWATKRGRRGTNWFEENYTIVTVETAANERTPQKADRFKGTLVVQGERWCAGEAKLEWLLVFTTCAQQPAWFHKWCLTTFRMFLFKLPKWIKFHFACKIFWIFCHSL